MQKINFQNLPSTTTPINATNLNAMQTNVENVFNGNEEMGDIKPNSIVSKYGRLTSPNFDHQNPDNKPSMRFDMGSSSMTSMGPGDGYIHTYFWDNNGAYDTQLFIPNSAGNLKLRARQGGNWQNNWNIIPTQITGTFTPTILGLTTAGTATYTTQEGRYVLNGNLLHIEIKLVCKLEGSSGYIGIRGFPTNLGTLHDAGVCSVVTDLTSSNYPLFARIYYTQYLLLQYGNGGAFNQSWSSNKNIYISGTFILN